MSISASGNIPVSSDKSLALFGRRVQISGSANPKTDPALIGYGHELVRGLVKAIMTAGGGIVVGLGKEPLLEGADPNGPSLLFDWTALETAAQCMKSGFNAWPKKFGLPVVVSTSEKAESEIPENRRGLY